MRTFRNIFSHLSIIFSGMFITLTILNQYNPGMGFLTSTLSMVFIFLFCLSVVALSVVTILDNRRYAKHMYQRAEEAARWKKISANNQKPPQK
ncbi:MAG TPA: hypothetical protein PKA81_13500 [Clostridia bacterium]|nr:hypothetical protein [Clostridia bacterium]